MVQKHQQTTYLISSGTSHLTEHWRWLSVCLLSALFVVGVSEKDKRRKRMNLTKAVYSRHEMEQEKEEEREQGRGWSRAVEQGQLGIG